MKIKVLQIIPRLARAGAETMALNYAKFLDKNKYEVVTASCVAGGELEKDFAAAQSRVWVGSREKMGGRFTVWRALAKFAGYFQPDIIHTHLFGGDLAGWVLKVFFGQKTRWVATVHNRERGFSQLRMIVWKIILRRADKIIAVSPSTAEYAHERLGVPEEKIIVINNGIDLTPWLAVPPAVGNLRVLRMAVIGRLTKQKGQVYLLNALSQLKFDWQLEVFGIGEDEKKLKQLSQKLGIADKIFWRGLTTDLPSQFNGVDVVVAPSLWEGLSLAVMEAMAGGRAVVASLEAGNGLIENNVTGLLVPVNKLIGALELLASDRKKIALLGVNARAYAKKYFDIGQNARAVEAVYQQILNKRG